MTDVRSAFTEIYAIGKQDDFRLCYRTHKTQLQRFRVKSCRRHTNLRISKIEIYLDILRVLSLHESENGFTRKAIGFLKRNRINITVFSKQTLLLYSLLVLDDRNQV